MVRQRLSEEQRREEILAAALECFLDKGFKNTTMEAVIERTSLSKGGVYRYYSSTIQMLSDLMKRGTQYRLGLIKEFWIDHLKQDDSLMDCLVEGLYQKIIDVNPYKKLYALFLLEVPNNQALLSLKVDLEQHFFSAWSQEQNSLPALGAVLENQAFIEFINAMIIGVELLDMRKTFQEQPDFLKNMIRAYFENAIVAK